MAIETIFDNVIQQVYGAFRTPAQVSWEATKDDDVVRDLHFGLCVHLTDDHLIAPGVSTTKIPFFIMEQTYSDGDEQFGSNGHSWANAIPPVFTIQPASAVSILETTEFDVDDVDSFVVNSLLTSPTEAVVGAGNEDEAGILYTNKNWTGGGGGAVAVSTDVIVGQVINSVRTDRNNTSWLPFLSGWRMAGE